MESGKWGSPDTLWPELSRALLHQCLVCLFDTVGRCSILLKRIVTVSRSLPYPWLDNSVHHTNVGISIDPQSLLEVEWSYDVSLIGNDPQDHNRSWKLCWYENLACSQSEQVNIQSYSLPDPVRKLYFSSGRTIYWFVGGRCFSLTSNPTPCLPTYPWWRHSRTEPFWKQKTCTWCLHGHNFE